MTRTIVLAMSDSEEECRSKSFIKVFYWKWNFPMTRSVRHLHYYTSAVWSILSRNSELRNLPLESFGIEVHISNKCFVRSLWKCNFPTNQPTDRQTDRSGHRELTLPTMEKYILKMYVNTSNRNSIYTVYVQSPVRRRT